MFLPLNCSFLVFLHMLLLTKFNNKNNKNNNAANFDWYSFGLKTASELALLVVLHYTGNKLWNQLIKFVIELKQNWTTL